MRLFRASFPAVVMVLSVVVGAARAEDSHAAFDAMFGKAIAEVEATDRTNDDATLAGELLKAAKTVADRPLVLKLLCEKVYELGSKTPAGYPAAAGAMTLAASALPAMAGPYLGKALEVQQRQYHLSRGGARRHTAAAVIATLGKLINVAAAAGNHTGAVVYCRRALLLANVNKLAEKKALQEQLQILLGHERTAKNFEAATARLAANPDDPEARKSLVHLHVVVRDDPGAAIKWLTPEMAAPYPKLVPLATKDPAGLSEADCLALALWYDRLGEGAELSDKPAMLRRAKGYYTAYLGKHPAADAARSGAEAALARILVSLPDDPTPTAAPAPPSPAGPLSAAALVTDPAEVPGVSGWTLETRRPRAALLAVAYRPDGRLLATAGKTGAIRLWEAGTGKLLSIIVVAKPVLLLAFSPDGKTLAAAGTDKAVRLVSPASGLTRQVFKGHSGHIAAMAWSPDGAALATCDRSATIRVWNAAGTSTRAVAEKNPASSVLALAFSPDGKTLAAGLAGGKIRLWPTDWSALPETALLAEADPVDLAFSPDGKKIAVAMDDRTVGLYTLAEKKGLCSAPTDSLGPTALAFSPDGARLVTAERPAEPGQADIRIWDAATAEVLASVSAHDSDIFSIAISPDGKTIATASADGTTKLIDLATETVRGTIGVPRLRAACPPAFSPDGKIMAFPCSDATIRMWDTATGRFLPSLALPGPAYDLAWDPTGNRLLVTCRDKALNLIDAATGQTLRALKDPTFHHIKAVAFSPDGRLFAHAERAQAGADGKVYIWDAATCRPVGVLAPKLGDLEDVTFSADGKTLACAGGKVIRLYDVSTGKPRRTLTGHTDDIYQLAFSPEGRLASAGRDRTIRVWSAGNRPRVLTGHQRYVVSLTFSPDGSRLASTSQDATIAIWNPKDGTIVRMIAAWASSAHWLPDGKTLVGASDGGARFWAVADGALRSQFVPLTGAQGFVVTAEGHYAGTKGVADELTVVSLTADGQRTLTPEQFAAAFAWKNDPTRVRLVDPKP